MAEFIDCNIDWVFLTAACTSDTTKTVLVETTSEVSHPALVEGDFEVLDMETSGIDS